VNWREAFLAQAGSDREVYARLNADDMAGLPECHRLHYLQMLSEKLAKAYECRRTGQVQPRETHGGLPSLLRSTISNRAFREFMDYPNAKSFGAMVRSLLPVAEAVDRLAPRGGEDSGPNAEYPWSEGGQVTAPCFHGFEEIVGRNRVQLERLEKLLRLVLLYEQQDADK